MKSELDASYERYVTGISTLDIPLQEDMHKYMCIRLSGYLEQLIFTAIYGYLQNSSGGPARNFTFSFFKKAPNLTPDALESLVGRFGNAWKDDLRAFLHENERRNNLGQLLAIRNKVAHGQSYRGGRLTVATYKKLIDEIHSWVLTTMLA